MFIYYSARINGNVVGIFESYEMAEDFLNYQATIADEPFEPDMGLFKCECDLFRTSSSDSKPGFNEPRLNREV